MDDQVDTGRSQNPEEEHDKRSSEKNQVDQDDWSRSETDPDEDDAVGSRKKRRIEEDEKICASPNSDTFDDIIADIINQMREAMEADREANENKQAATHKLNLLPFVMNQLRKVDLRDAFLDSDVLTHITEWLAPLPDRSLPHLNIRESLLKVLSDLNLYDVDRIKSSGIGKAVMYLYKHPKETKENKQRAKQLISCWSRPIFQLDSSFTAISREEREQLWTKFRKFYDDSNWNLDFAIEYAAYDHFRSRGWVVKCGGNYGVNFLLYRKGPPADHSQYAVLVLRDEEHLVGGNQNWQSLLTYHRVIKSVKKEFVVALVRPVGGAADLSRPDCVRNMRVRLMTFTSQSQLRAQ